MNILTLLTFLLPALTQGGGILMQLYPQIAHIIEGLSGANPASHTNIVSYIQDAINALNTAGVIQLRAPLVVDGQFGGATFGAIKLVLAKAGLNLQEPVASIVFDALKGILNSHAMTGNILPPPRV